MNIEYVGVFGCLVILNYLIAKRYATVAISTRQLVSAWLITGFAIASFSYLISSSWAYLALLPLVLFSHAIVLCDLSSLRIPNQVNFALAVLAATLIVVGAGVEVGISPLTGLFAGTAIFLFLLAISLISNGSLGMGDVKLAWPWGVMLGFFGTDTALLALGFSFILAAILSIFLLILRKKGRKFKFAFGPFLLIGGWTALLVLAGI